MHFQKSIEQLGFSKYEARVYLAALRLGISNISEIAKKANIPRTTCYHVLGALEKRGLINYFMSKKGGSKKMYSAENPDVFTLMLREREAVIKEIVPQLKAVHREQGSKPTLYFYEGVDGIKRIFSDIIESQESLLAITSVEDALKVLGNFFDDFIAKRIARKIPIRFLTIRTEKTLAMQKNDQHELRITRFLPPNYKIRTATFVYGNKVALISFRRSVPIGLTIEDEDIVETHKMYFELAWQSAL